MNVIEADQSNIGPLESEDSDTGGVKIQGYVQETVPNMIKLDPNSNISEGDSDASVGGGQAPEITDQDKEIHTASSGKLILYECFISSVGLNIKAINILYAVDDVTGLQELGSASPSLCIYRRPVCCLSPIPLFSTYIYHYLSMFFLHSLYSPVKCKKDAEIVKMLYN